MRFRKKRNVNALIGKPERKKPVMATRYRWSYNTIMEFR